MVEKTYKCLNPVGNQAIVDLKPLAPRLDTLDGKTVVVCINAGGDQDITIPLLKVLPERYPNVNWEIKRKFGFSAELTEEEKKTADAMIAGVIW
ncbi:MAG TPA: hypothetical protein G4O15_09555 [Dehalococcoidia bacterium]|nr:hypothetical protein [Dehalococcoidia bacterium]